MNIYICIYIYIYISLFLSHSHSHSHSHTLSLTLSLSLALSLSLSRSLSLSLTYMYCTQKGTAAQASTFSCRFGLWWPPWACCQPEERSLAGSRPKLRCLITGFGFRIWGLGLRICSLRGPGFGAQVQGLGCHGNACRADPCARMTPNTLSSKSG